MLSLEYWSCALSLSDGLHKKAGILLIASPFPLFLPTLWSLTCPPNQSHIIITTFPSQLHIFLLFCFPLQICACFEWIIWVLERWFAWYLAQEGNSRDTTTWEDAKLWGEFCLFMCFHSSLFSYSWFLSLTGVWKLLPEKTKKVLICSYSTSRQDIYAWYGNISFCVEIHNITFL